MNSVKEKMRALLFARAGSPVSGEEAAGQLGVSRAAVWKAMEALRAEGLPIEAGRGRGYSLSPQSDILCEEALRPWLPEAAIRVLEETDSTNREAKRWALEGAPHGALVVAERQSAGRGRLGRSFASPPGGLYMSLVLRPEAQQPGLGLLTAATAVAVCRAAAALCERELSIKWVNDLFYEGKKCCGILTEGVAGLECGGFDYLVTGIGINFSTKEADFPKELRPVAGSLFPAAAPPVTRARLAAQIRQNLLDGFEKLADKTFLEEYRRRNFVPGHRVQVLAREPYEAEALLIDDEARLVVRSKAHGTEALSAGEVSVILEDLGAASRERAEAQIHGEV